MPEPFRLPAQGPVQAYQTYGIRQPLTTHWRRATCEEVGCEAYAKGWVTRVPIASQAAQFIRSKQHNRRFTEFTDRHSKGEAEFMFPPGQPCFRVSEHRAPVGRPPLYIVRAGDHRQNLGGIRQHTRPEDWRDDLGEHLEMIKDKQKKG